MADLTYRNDRSADWGAIWAGMFAFVAIWAVFGALGLAIFASAANPNTATAATGLTVGEGIWYAILTLVAMYVGGRVTGHLARCVERRDALIHGLAMFGLSIAAMTVLFAGRTVFSPAAEIGGVRSPYVLAAIANAGWISFVALFLGWIGAMLGTNAGVKTDLRSDVRGLRPAA